MRRHRIARAAATAVSALLALLLAACSGGADSAGPIPTSSEEPSEPTAVPTTPATEQPDASPTATPADTPTEGREVQVYFIAEGMYATAVRRTISGTEDVAANALRALLDGPTDAEAAQGLSTAIPEDTLLLGITIEDGLATVDFSREYESGGGSFAILSRLAQVVYTLAQFPTVEGVNFRLDGQAVTLFSGEGVELDEPATPEDYTSALPIGAPAERWSQDDLPSLDGVAQEDQRRVVLVTGDDVLNVRSAAGTGNAVVGMLEPGVIVEATGGTEQAGDSEWAEVEVPGGTGWVNARFLGAVVDDAAFAADPRVEELLDRFARIAAERGDLGEIASRRGLLVSHFAPLVSFSQNELATVMTDATLYRWGSQALGADSPELPERTFAEAVGDRWVSTWDDEDAVVTYDEAQLGGNGTPAEHAIPFELQGFHFVSVYDSGDNPEYGGLDWTAWYVAIDYEDGPADSSARGEPVVVAMTLNEWAP